MQTLSDIRAALAERGLAPRKSLGQNFLIDQNLARRLVGASGVGPGDCVLEVGPGTGVLTDHLVELGCRVVACELDAGLSGMLRERFAGPIAGGTFVLVEGDCLDGPAGLHPGVLAALGEGPFTLVSNLPYGAASPLMVRLVSMGGRCRGQFVTIQREVARRLSAGPGTRDYGELGVVVQAMASVARIATLPPECFWPRPKVVSEMVGIVPRAVALTADIDRLSRVCRLLFTKRRKQIGGTVGPAAARAAGIDAEIRPERLGIEELERLARVLDSAGGLPGAGAV